MIKQFLKKAYTTLPVGPQNVIISAAGLRWRHQRFGGDFKTMLERLKHTEWYRSEMIERFENERLRMVIRHAYDNVPYYKELVDSCGASPDDIRDVSSLGKLPLLTKAIAREQGRRLVADGPGALRRFETSGSTGTPLTVWKTPHTERFQWAVWWRHRARFGLRLGDPFLTFGARAPSFSSTSDLPIWRTNYAISQSYLPMFQLTPQTMPAVVEWINRSKFAFFAGYPSGMAVLARFMRDEGLKLIRPPKVVSCGSESLTPGTAELLREQFGAPVTQLYGLAESCGGLAACEEGRLHVDFELGLVEMLPIAGSDDPTLRRLVLTSFEADAMPFIRYDSGDFVRPFHGACPCGRETVAVESVDGRLEDCIQTRDGRQVFGLNQVFKLARHVRESQVVQHSLDEIEVRIVPAHGYDPSVEKVIREELKLRTSGDLKVRFSLVDEIALSPNGKYRAVISHLPRPK